ncbi:tetratricopeptide repeat protein [Microcoleus sp. CAWBG58]|uniref:tetratricopeptide repeat protein n=1 Tax=Microcoleus sp. CAWBG58 TaxID=2841651 RepID=UPI0025D9D9EA|nr:tetratricopeptide repeat protein [Microcoleus sp. CAWBG58]
MGDQDAKRDIFNFRGKVKEVTVNNHPTPVRPPADRDLLEAVRQLVEPRLKAQLHHHVKLNLSKETQPEQVRPWGMEVKVTIAQPSQLLPPETTIAQVFDRCSGRLLILGEPGAGKTTSLLDLALELVARAEADSQQRIPVVVDLSDWQPTAPEATSRWGMVASRRAGFSQKNHRDDRPEPGPVWSIADWLAAKVREKYGFTPQQIGQWLAEKQLVPLLDGLDEVRPEYQQECVKAINEWLNFSDLRPRQVALCCRREQYEAYPEKLKLQGAVYLQDLTDEQIQTFLQKANRSELSESLVADANLLALIRRPLLLSMAVLAYGEIDPIEWHRATSANARLNLLLDAYVQRMLTQDTDSRFYRKGKIPSVEQSRKWLEILALQLLQGSETEFLIEKMQPIWLSTSLQKWMYGVTIGIFLGLIFGLSAVGIWSSPSLFWFGLGGGVFWSLIEGWEVWKDRESIKSVGAIRISLSGLKPKKVLRKLSSSEFILFFTQLIIGGIIRRLVDPKWDFKLALIYLIIGLVTVLLTSEVGTNINKVEIMPIANQGIGNSLRNVIPTTLTFATLWTLAVGFVRHLDGKSFVSPFSLQYTLVSSSSTALFIWIAWQGGSACLQHFTLRLCLSSAGSIPWNYARFLNYATERLLLQRVGGRYRFMHDLLRQSLAQSRIDTHPSLISSPFLTRCGESYLLMEQYEEALQNFDRAIEIDPKHTWAIANRGLTYRLMERYEEALQDFDRAIELDHKYDSAIWHRGYIYLILGRYDRALKDLDRAIELDSKEDWYQYLRAITYLASNQSNAAKANLDIALRLAQQEYINKPANYVNIFNQALYHLVAGNLSTAREFYQIALEQNASPAYIRNALQDLEDLLKVLGDVPYAKQMIEELKQHLK